MKLKEKILYFVLSIFKVFLPLFKIKDRIVFVSLESDVLSGEFKILYDHLKEEYETILLLTKFEKTLLGNFKYFITCIKQLFVLNTSKLVILDFNNYVISKFKRDGVKVLQLWHASGAIKKFGNAINRDYKVDNYDVVVANAASFKPFYKEGFNVKEEDVKVTGIINTDVLYDKQYLEVLKNKMYDKYPQIKDKTCILYAPTFRGRLMSGFKGSYLEVDKLASMLGEKYIIFYKMHPLLSNYHLEVNSNVIKANDEDLFSLFSVSDYLISDYSALIFDYSILNKPMCFYVPDIEEYKADTGLFIEYEKEMPGKLCYCIDDVIHALKQPYDYEKLNRFYHKYHAYSDGKSLDRVLCLIRDLMK